MHIAILGRQPAISIAELEKVFGGSVITPLSNEAAMVDSDYFDIQKLGGSPKAGLFIQELLFDDWHKVSQKLVQHYASKWSKFEGKITLGISAYGFKVDNREVQKTGIILKQKLKKSDISLRLIPNPEPALNSAVSHHNKLGLSPNKIELLIIRTNNGNTVIAESTGAQNITAIAKRDQGRPKRDAFVGMLPPKLAQIMINLATITPANDMNMVVLDPFCGTGVVLQEAALMGYNVYGTDLSEKMIRYSRDNLNWLADFPNIRKFDWYLHEGDAMDTKWRQPINAVVSETYLGQPFSAPPSPTKLEEVVKNCDHIITEFLKNLSGQIKPGTPICIAVPAWRDTDGNFTHLPLIATIARLGYKPHEFMNISQNDLLYYRENQVVARRLLVLTRV
ncbi:methyltransferase domain-containing protein [Candidatus Saccharibacteria bacterium]|nr:methyltransferase domain-containing protein [Candidatus Saccharibacteria bacterium]